jgi:hypothetical protein
MYVAALLLMMRCDSVLVCSNVGVCGGGGGGDGNDANNDWLSAFCTLMTINPNLAALAAAALSRPSLPISTG